MSDVMTQEQAEAAAEQKDTPETFLIKRSVTIKSQVTDAFRQKANNDLGEEVKTIDKQLQQLQVQYQETLKQLEDAARQGHNVSQQMDQLHRDVRTKQGQLKNLKTEVSQQLQNLDKVQNGDYVITGQLENFVDLKVGDNLYDKLRDSEILLKDGVITAILG